MAYHTPLYLFVFLPVVLILYQLSLKKLRWLVLLLAGYAFFWSFSKDLLIYLIGTTIFTHYIGVFLAYIKSQCEDEIQGKDKTEKSQIRKRYQKWERIILAGGILSLIGLLGYLKYYNFFVQNANLLLNSVGLTGGFQVQKLLLPIGISFYTLQAISYMADVYWGKIPAEKNLAKFALYLAFFPQIMEGPISTYSQTADALWRCESLKGENLSSGAIRIVWGLFKKMIIADRLYVLVQAIFEHYENFGGLIVAGAAVAYTIQLYMEFSGCMDIVIGTGKLFGIVLPENFRQPFASKNAAEFWRRWHITLGAWLKAYVFYPVSVSGIVKKWNKFGKKKCGKYITKIGVSAMALFPVWLCNGLWHGARWSYLFYGMYYFVILMAGIILEPVRGKVLQVTGLNEHALYWKIPQILKTWVIIFVGELFFRANGLRAGFHMFKSIFTEFNFNQLWDGTFLTLGLDKGDYSAVLMGCVVVAIVGMIKERNVLGEQGLQRTALPIRWAVYYSLILAVIIFGAYGVGYQTVDLIYAGF